jgi:hypothetical protein
MGEADDAEADAATSRRLGFDGVKTAASAISTSSPSPSPLDEDEVTVTNCALLTGMTRVAEEAEEEEGARRGRFFFDGVSGSEMPWSSSSEADAMSESEKATLTLRFALLAREEAGVAVRFASRRMADLVGEADRECDGVLVVAFDVDAGADSASFFSFNFLRIALIWVFIDSFNVRHSSSIIFMRELKSLSEAPCSWTNGTSCTFESLEIWAGRAGR